MKPQRHRFVIVGAGLAGAATAWHLRRAGVTDVVLLERERVPGVHSSGRNAAMLREAMDTPALRPLAAESAPHLRSGALAEFRATGGLLVGRGTSPVSERVPPARGQALWCPNDGVVDVAALLQRYLEGAAVRYDCLVEGFTETAHGLRIRTSRGPIDCETLVNAAGAWAGLLGDLPLQPKNRHLFVSEHDADIDPAWPFVWHLDAGYYLRPESGGWLLSACDETDAAPGDYTHDAAVLEDLSEKMRSWQPDLADLRIARTWVGQRTFAPDRLPVIGFDPGRPRVFHVAGLGGHGVTLSWSIGRRAADALRGARPVPAALDPARLAHAAP